MKAGSGGTAVAKKGGCEKMRLCEKPGMGRAGARECATSWQSPARTPPARCQVATLLQSTGGGHQATTRRTPGARPPHTRHAHASARARQARMGR